MGFVLLVVYVFVVEDFVGEEKVGEVVKIDSSDNDLFTVWVLRMFYSLFAYVAPKDTVSFRAVDADGVERTFHFKRYTYHYDCRLFNTYFCASGVRVRYGTSSTPPSRTDYRLLQEIYVDNNPRLVLDEGRGFVMVVSTVTFTSDTTICEVGLSLYTVTYCTEECFDFDGETICYIFAEGCGEFLLDRTVFSPCRRVPANTPYTVRYRVQL
jgi:hypothetical protein